MPPSSGFSIKHTKALPAPQIGGGGRGPSHAAETLPPTQPAVATQAMARDDDEDVDVVP